MVIESQTFGLWVVAFCILLNVNVDELHIPNERKVMLLFHNCEYYVQVH